MAKKIPRKGLHTINDRLEKRREAEVAYERKKTTKKKAVRKRAKDKTRSRKQLIWGVFDDILKEQARFPYYQRSAAEEKVKQLRAMFPEKMFFIQPIKESIDDTPSNDKEK